MLNKLNFFQKLSLSTGVLAGCAALITSLGATWGFVAFSQQISATILAVVAFINLFFLGKTAQTLTVRHKFRVFRTSWTKQSQSRQ